MKKPLLLLMVASIISCGIAPGASALNLNSFCSYNLDRAVRGWGGLRDVYPHVCSEVYDPYLPYGHYNALDVNVTRRPSNVMTDFALQYLQGPYDLAARRHQAVTFSSY